MVFVLQKQLVYYLLKFLQLYMEENLITWRLTHQLHHASKQPHIVRNKICKKVRKHHCILRNVNSKVNSKM